MSQTIQPVELLIFFGVFYVALPCTIVWGWLRWMRSPRTRGISPILSLIGFILATASALVAVSSLVYARVIGGFAFYDPLLMRIYRDGGLVSVSGTLFASVGVWRRSPIRWHALCCALGTLIFWIVAAAGE